ncbi:MAG: hypothetical protein ABL877_02020 [Thiobacillus sp.]
MRHFAVIALMLMPASSWANRGIEAERAAERILLSENVAHVYFTANDAGRLTLLFGNQVADWQIRVVLKKLEQDPAIQGVTHARAETDFCPIR